MVGWIAQSVGPNIDRRQSKLQISRHLQRWVNWQSNDRTSMANCTHLYGVVVWYAMGIPRQLNNQGSMSCELKRGYQGVCWMVGELEVLLGRSQGF